MTRIKICGITNLADARYAAGAGADYLGFIQHPESPRFIDAAKAAEIIEWVHGPLAVGVFVNLDPGDVNRIAEQAGFDLVQLHGDEGPEECGAVGRPVIKAIRIASGAPITSGAPISAGAPFTSGAPTASTTPANSTTSAGPQPVASAQDLLAEIDRYRGHVDYFLFDTASDIWGGSGKSFDWAILDAIPKDIEWFLAGGLTPFNVASALENHAPFAVDTSSGVESEPGSKEFESVDTFISQVRKASAA